MVGGALMAILFVCTLVCWAIWSLIYGIFVSHYVLTTLTDSSSGLDEVQYPKESIFDWWWKPILCAWVLVIWLIPATVVLAPLGFFSPEAFIILWTLILWAAFPLSLASVLYAQHWLVFVHRGVLGRMAQHFGAFAYVYVMTLAMFVGCVWLLVRGVTDFVWMVPAALLVPAAQLLYARHWGRFAWLSLNYLPRQSKQARAAKPTGATAVDPWQDPPPVEPPVTEPAQVDAGIREGMPPTAGSAAQDSTAITAASSSTPSDEPYDEWTDFRPYALSDDPEAPFAATETTPAPSSPPAAAAPAPVLAEEEDEWATEKKPYGVIEPEAKPASPEAAPAVAHETDSDANKPVTVEGYYARRAKKEKAAKRKAEEEARTMPAPSKKTPSFNAALIKGVWGFLLYPSTMLAWLNLVVFTLVEFLLLFALFSFWPKG